MAPTDARDEVVLRPAKGKTAWFLVTSLVVTGGGIVLALNGGGFLPAVAVGFFGICSLYFALMLLPGASYIYLTHDGFVLCKFFQRDPLVAWSRIHQFRVVSRPPLMNKTVVYHEVGDYQSGSQRLIGDGARFPNTYGLSMPELAALLNDWRVRYARGG